jgi:hypothetical protein
VTPPATAEAGYQTGVASGGLNSANGGSGLIYIDWFLASTVSGTVLDGSGNPVARTVRGYLRTTGALVGETTSSASNGAYSLVLEAAPGDEIQVICLDDTAGTLENDLIHRAFTV